MNEKVNLAKNEIDGIEFEIVINLDNDNPVNILYINGNPWWFGDVDFGQVVRAVLNSDNVSEFTRAIEGVWCENELLERLSEVFPSVEMLPL